MSDTVVVLYYSEDGDPPRPEQMSAAQLEKRLAEHHYGSNPAFATGREAPGSFAGLLVIRGKIVQPQPEAKVTAWKIP